MSEPSLQQRINFQASPEVTSTFVGSDLTDDSTSFTLNHPSYAQNQHVPLPHIPHMKDIEMIGTGGMAVVYRAKQPDLGRTVAIKMLNLKHGHDSVAAVRLQSEAAAMAQLRHPGITQVFEYGSYDNSPYIVMEYLDGGTLADLIKKHQLPTRWVARTVETVARAVQHAHDRAIIHRDLKPSNILLTREGQPKVSDFGVAKLMKLDLQLTQTNQFMGTPQYTSPEQLKPAGTITTLVDIYSLGVILYEALTGQPPHKGTTTGEVVYKVLHTEPIKPRRLRPEIPRDLETICMKCLDKDPEKRYHTAEALADDLQAFLEKMPITARPVSVTERVWKWCRRHPVSAALLGWLVTLLLVGSTIAFQFAYWAFDESTRANQAETLISLERNKALQAKKRAEEQYEIVKKTNNFLQVDLLQRIGNRAKTPSSDSSFSMLQALDEATARIGNRFSNEPLVEASIRQILGESYYHLGHTDQAIGQLEKALQIRRSVENLAIDDVYRDVAILYEAYYKNSQFEKFATLLREQAEANLLSNSH